MKWDLSILGETVGPKEDRKMGRRPTDEEIVLLIEQIRATRDKLLQQSEKEAFGALYACGFLDGLLLSQGLQLDEDGPKRFDAIIQKIKGGKR